MISRQHLKRIRLTPSNDVSWAFMLINDSLQIVIAIPRLIVLSCSLFFRPTSIAGRILGRILGATLELADPDGHFVEFTDGNRFTI